MEFVRHIGAIGESHVVKLDALQSAVIGMCESVNNSCCGLAEKEANLLLHGWPSMSYCAALRSSCFKDCMLHAESLL